MPSSIENGAQTVPGAALGGSGIVRQRRLSRPVASVSRRKELPVHVIFVQHRPQLFPEDRRPFAAKQVLPRGLERAHVFEVVFNGDRATVSAVYKDPARRPADFRKFLAGPSLDYPESRTGAALHRQRRPLKYDHPRIEDLSRGGAAHKLKQPTGITCPSDRG